MTTEEKNAAAAILKDISAASDPESRSNLIKDYNTSNKPQPNNTMKQGQQYIIQNGDKLEGIATLVRPVNHGPDNYWHVHFHDDIEDETYPRFVNPDYRLHTSEKQESNTTLITAARKLLIAIEDCREDPEGTWDNCIEEIIAPAENNLYAALPSS